MGQRVNVEPAIGLVSLTENAVTTRLAVLATTVTDDEQLFAVSDSSATVSTHAP